MQAQAYDGRRYIDDSVVDEIWSLLAAGLSVEDVAEVALVEEMVVREIDHQRLADVEAKARAKALRMQPATVEQLRQKYADYRARGAARTQEEKIRVIREVADANPHMAIRTIARVLRHEWYTVAAVLPERRKNAANSDLIR